MRSSGTANTDGVEFIERTWQNGLKSQQITLFLCQIQFAIESESLAQKNTTETWNTILSCLNTCNVQASKDGINFVVFPEATIPIERVEELVDVFKQGGLTNAVLIAGIEHASAQRLFEIARQLGIDDKHTVEVLKNAKNRKINSTLILVPDKRGNKLLLQFKIFPSKYEASLVAGDSLAGGNFIYHVKNESLSFMVICCSDMFNRASGANFKISDRLDHELKRGKALDILFNIQYNPSPDHHFFPDALSRIYDDGHNSSDIATVIVNSVIQSGVTGGHSKILFYKDKVRTDEKLPLQGIQAPVRGFEFDQSQKIIIVTLDRPPRSWDLGRESHPIHYRVCDINGKDLRKATIKQIEQFDNFNPSTPEEKLALAEKLSQIGKFNEAIRLAKEACDAWKRKYIKAAQASHFIASQYRHMGKFESCLMFEADAESYLRRETTRNIEWSMMNWRIKASITMVETHFKSGRFSKAIADHKILRKEISHALQLPGLTDDVVISIKTCLLNIDRQICELERCKGRLKSALKIRNIRNKYSYQHVQEILYSRLIEAECQRGLNSYGVAEHIYREVLRYARNHHDARLEIRVLRCLAELERTSGRDCQKTLDVLRDIISLPEYRFGHIYANLTQGGFHLQCGRYEQALEVFEEAKALAVSENDALNVELAHSLFGIGEAKRLAKDESSVYELRQALDLYLDFPMSWGIIRTMASLYTVNASLLTKRWKSIPLPDSPSDRALLALIRSEAVPSHETFFINLP